MLVDQTKTDEDLIQALRSGSREGLDELFRRYYQDLCVSSLRIVNDRKDAEDVVQEFFVSIWNRRDSLSKMDNVSSYFHRSIRNRSLNFLRDQKRIPSGDIEAISDMASNESEASVVMETKELQARIDKAINLLPERCRMVFVLSKFEDMKQKEIAEKLGISVKTVENQMTRAYRFLKSVLSVSIPFLLYSTLIISYIS